MLNDLSSDLLEVRASLQPCAACLIRAKMYKFKKDAIEFIKYIAICLMRIGKNATQLQRGKTAVASLIQFLFIFTMIAETRKTTVK